MTVTVDRHRWPLPLVVSVTVAVAVGLAVEPVGFDGFFRAYGIYGRIMRMVGAWGHYAYARHACVMGVRGDRGKDPQKKGCAAWRADLA